MPVIKPDLHPDDPTHRIQTVAAAIKARQASGMSQHAVANRIGVVHSTVSAFERGRKGHHNPAISTIQAHTWATGHTVRFELAELPDIDLDLTGLSYETMATATTGPVAHMWQRTLLLHRMIGHRLRLGWTRIRLADAMGCSEGSVQQIEEDRPDPLLLTYQRYTRALGGALTVHIESAVRLEVVT